LPHRPVVVESDPRPVALPRPPDHLIRLHLIARPDAPVAENTRLMIDADDRRGVVDGPAGQNRFQVPGWKVAGWKDGCSGPFASLSPTCNFRTWNLEPVQLPRQGLQLAVARLLLFRAGGRVVGHEE